MSRSINRLLLAVLAGVFSASNLYAWEATVYSEDLEGNFYVDSFTGDYLWTTLREGGNADSGTGTSLPSNTITQNWNGSTWPSDSIFDEEIGTDASAEMVIDHYEGVENDFFDYAEIYVYGDISPDTSYGGSWFYEFELMLDPFSSANVYLDSLATYGEIQSDTGDEGNAFASIKLFSTDVDLNDPGGANVPYDIDAISLAAPPTGESVYNEFSLSHTFTNPGSTPITYNLSLTASVSIFESAASVELAGDYNDDDTVDAADYTVWRDSLGAPAGTLPNDTDGGVIGSAQYDTWVNNYGMSLGMTESSASSIPEPGTALLTLVGATLNVLGRKRNGC